MIRPTLCLIALAATLLCMPAAAHATAADEHCAAKIGRLVPAPTDERVVRVGSVDCMNGDAHMGGTGWVSESGMVVTVSHNVDRAGQPRAWIRTSTGTQLARTIILDADQDLTLLIPMLPGELPPPLPLAKEVRVGASLIGLGHVKSSTRTETQRFVVARALETKAAGLLHEYGGRARHGFSGGPMINIAGEVVGVITSVDANGSNHTRGVPPGTVHDLIAHVEGTALNKLATDGPYEPAWKTGRSTVLNNTDTFQCQQRLPLT